MQTIERIKSQRYATDLYKNCCELSKKVELLFSCSNRAGYIICQPCLFVDRSTPNPFCFQNKNRASSLAVTFNGQTCSKWPQRFQALLNNAKINPSNCNLSVLGSNSVDVWKENKNISVVLLESWPIRINCSPNFRLYSLLTRRGTRDIQYEPYNQNVQYYLSALVPLFHCFGKALLWLGCFKPGTTFFQWPIDGCEGGSGYFYIFAQSL